MPPTTQQRRINPARVELAPVYKAPFLSFAVPVLGAFFNDFDFGGGELKQVVDPPVELGFEADDLLGVLLVFRPAGGQPIDHLGHRQHPAQGQPSHQRRSFGPAVGSAPGPVFG